MNPKKLIFTVLLSITPSVLWAADDAQEISDNILSALRYIINIVGPLIVIIVLAFNGGISYMTKGKDQRSSEDGAELKQTLIRILVGGGLTIGAANLGVTIWDLLGGN